MPGFAARIPRTQPGGTPVETLSGLSAAGEQRFWDAVELGTCLSPKRTGSLYLFGYAAELILKTAFYKARFGPRLAASDDLNLPIPGATQSPFSLAKSRVFALGGGNFHDLGLIWTALKTERLASEPIAPEALGALDFQLELLAGHWKEWIRYRDEAASEEDLAEVYAAVDRLRSVRSAI